MRPEFLKNHKLTYQTNQAEWYLDDISTGYCHQQNLNGIALLNHYCYIVYLKNEDICERVIVEYSNKGEGQVIFSALRLEDIGGRIDMIKVAKSHGVI